MLKLHCVGPGGAASEIHILPGVMVQEEYTSQDNNAAVTI
jgi:hypothetical protein